MIDTCRAIIPPQNPPEYTSPECTCIIHGLPESYLAAVNKLLNCPTAQASRPTQPPRTLNRMYNVSTNIQMNSFLFPTPCSVIVAPIEEAIWDGSVWNIAELADQPQHWKRSGSLRCAIFVGATLFGSRPGAEMLTYFSTQFAQHQTTLYPSFKPLVRGIPRQQNFTFATLRLSTMQMDPSMYFSQYCKVTVLRRYLVACLAYSIQTV